MSRLFVLTALLASCGGGAPSTGGKLRHTLDETHIASVPVEEKTQILEAKNALERARMEQDTHEAQLKDVKTKVDIAKNEEKQAKLALDSAKKEKSEADKSADRTRINNADRQLRTAELGEKAAHLKVEFLRAKKSWLEKAVFTGKVAVYAKEARWELEKAKVASSRNIRPSGFNLADFDKQNRERADKYAGSKKDADGKKNEAEKKRQEWNAKEQEYMSAKGQSGTPESSAGLDGTSTQTPKPSSTSTNNNAVLK
jgi:hypothetical protein